MVRRAVGAMLAIAALPALLAAQGPSTVTGTVTSTTGSPLLGASVSISDLGVGAATRDDGRYTFLIPAARVQGQTVQLAVRLIGYKPRTVAVTLRPGSITQDFSLETNPLQLGEVVITGAGTTTEVEKLGNVRNTVSAEQIMKSNEPNLIQALAGKAPNVEVKQSSGEPGASSYIRIRGPRTLSGTGQPLIVVDGMPIDNFSYSTSNFNPVDELSSGEGAGTAQSNRAADINPDDIESVEILKGPAAGAIYGARAGQGVILITTKRGRAGPTRYSFRSSYSWDEITTKYPLQRSWGVGSGGITASCPSATCVRSWGGSLSTLPTFDHASEAFDAGHISDNNLSVSGGNDRTTFYFSVSYLKNEGIFKGPNNEFERATVRLNASHRLVDAVNLAANIAYADTRGEFVHRGNNANGLALGLLRTPPNFDNQPWKDENGLQRSFRRPTRLPSEAALSSGFDNPFWALYENQNTAKVGRVFGNVSADYTANDWLKFTYTLGADYSNDERLEGMPIGSAGEGAAGRITEGNIVNYQIDHNLSGTANYTLSPNFSGTVTLGQNLNTRSTRQISVVGRTLIAPRPFKLTNTVGRDLPLDTEENVHNESYFGQVTLDLYEQLFLAVAARNDGSSTFGADNRRNWFPKASAAWTFTNYLGEQPWVTFGKLRLSYGEAGQEPDAYLTSVTFDGTTPISGVVQGTGLSPTQAGLGGLVTALTKAASVLRPERTKEFETGFDIGLWKDIADLSFTYYNAQTEDVILLTPLAPSTGYYRQAQNSGEFSNKGIELSLNLRPVRGQTVTWDVGFQWAKNKSNVDRLDAENSIEFIYLDGINTISPYAVAMQGQPVGVFFDYGPARCGISPTGLDAVILGVDLATACAGAPYGALYIAADGFPVGDDNQRIVGDPNPDWTGSVRSGLRYKKVQLSGLLDIRKGGTIFNGTRGALRAYGTHKDTEVRANCPTLATCTGNEHVMGSKGFYEGPVVGPGANMPVSIGENWYSAGLGNCLFSGYAEDCMEDGGYVKLRELSVAYAFDNPWVERNLGFASIDLRLAGRNLKTWTDYTGFDPETEFGQAIQRTRGMDYFNMPQSRSFVLSVGLNR